MYGTPQSSPSWTSLPPITLVSNTGQTRANESGAVQSQPFTTGSNLGGYTLTSVDVGFATSEPGSFILSRTNTGNGGPTCPTRPSSSL